MSLMRSLKVLHVIGTLNPEYGGPVSALASLVQASTVLAAPATVLTLDAPDAPWLAGAGERVVAVGPGVGRLGSVGYGYTPRLVQWLRANVDRFDAVVVHGIWQYQSFGVWRVLRHSQIPYYVFPHGALDPWFKAAYPLKHLKKWLYWPWSEYRVLRDARGVLFTCEQERLDARESFWLYRCNEIVSGLGTQAPPHETASYKRAFFARYPELCGKRLLLYLSRIHEKKGCDLLIDAFAKVAAGSPDLHLVMAGPDSTRLTPALQAAAEKHGIAARVCWPGMIDGDVKWGALYSADAFVLPSHSENFGVAVAEALGCGVPVLISKKVNIWRGIDSDGAGIVADDTADGTAELLMKWLALGPAAASEMRGRAKLCFQNRFEITGVTEKLFEMIRRDRQKLADGRTPTALGARDGSRAVLR